MSETEQAVLQLYSEVRTLTEQSELLKECLAEVIEIAELVGQSEEGQNADLFARIEKTLNRARSLL
jgi:hypothetical protein